MGHVENSNAPRLHISVAEYTFVGIPYRSPVFYLCHVGYVLCTMIRMNICTSESHRCWRHSGWVPKVLHGMSLLCSIMPR